jgi:hypothetical protein
VTAAAARSLDISALAAYQAGLLTRDQLRAAGVSADIVRNHVRARRWQTLGRRVVATHAGPLTAEQTRWWAVLDGGPTCVLSGLSALHDHGLQGFPVERVQTAVPCGAGRPVRYEQFVRRVSRRLDAGSVHPARRPPTLRVTAALLDALENISLPLRGSALLAAVVQQRLLRPQDVRPLIVDTSTLPFRRTYVAVAGDIEGGAHSLVEINFRRLAREAGIPPPRGQSTRLDRFGRRRYLDADFGAWAAEVDGAIHLRPMTWWDDTWRLNEITLGGKPTLRFPSVGIYLKRDMVIDQLQRAANRWGSAK